MEQNQEIKELSKTEIRSGFEEAYKSMLNSSEYKNDYMFYAFMIAHMKIQFDEKMPAPAGVNFMINCYNLYINPRTFNPLPLIQRLGILKHEVLHCLNNHVGRKEDRKHETWNYACDNSINQQITRTHLPEGCIYPDVLEEALKQQGKNIKFPVNKHAEFYYDLLKDHIQEKESDGSEDGEGQGDSDGDSQDSDGDGKQSDKQSDKYGKAAGDHSKWKESKGDDELRKNITKKMIEESIGKTSKQKGNTPQDIEHYLDLFTRKAIVSWKKVLKNLTGNKRVNSRETVMRKSRRFPERPDIRGKCKDRMFELVVVVDVSGSMSDDEIMKGLTEIHEICKITNSSMKLIQVDTVIHNIETFSKQTRVFARNGCGGTYMGSAMSHIATNKIENDLVVLISDCEIEDISTWSHPPKKLIVLNTTRGTKCPGIQHYGSRYREFNLQDEA